MYSYDLKELEIITSSVILTETKNIKNEELQNSNIYYCLMENTDNDPDNTEKFIGDIKVIIIGGGLGGLAAALSLQLLGISCKVYERDTELSVRKQGYGLTLTNNIKGPLAQLGLLSKCIHDDCASFCHWVFHSTGYVLGYYGRAFSSKTVTTESEIGRGNLRIPREDLRKMLLESLSPETVSWGKRMVSLNEELNNVVIEFEDIKSGLMFTEKADVVIGADGIRSAVRAKRDIDYNSKVHNSYQFPDDKVPPPICLGDLSSSTTSTSSTITTQTKDLNYVHVAVIIGIGMAQHPLLRKQGFYVLDGTHRLFTMPFRGSSTSSSSTSGSSTGSSSTGSDGSSGEYQTMWQLSFSGLSEEEARRLRKLSEAGLLEEATRRTKDWFDPVPDLIRSTVPGEVWAAALYDRDAMSLWGKNTEGSRVTVIGDACHPMSMFKGQGANQALEDGPLLASWLVRGVSNSKGGLLAADCPTSTTAAADSKKISRRTLLTRLKCFEREMVARSSSKVLASRAAASHLHSPAALSDSYPIEGLGSSEVALEALRSSGVGARDAEELEGKAREVFSSLELRKKPRIGVPLAAFHCR